MSENLENLAALWAKNRGQAQTSSTDLVYSTQSAVDFRTDQAATVKQNSQSKVQAKLISGLSGDTKSPIRVHRETKGRGGKAVTVITGLVLEDLQLHKLSKELKALCGSGGTVKESGIEVQGDHVDRVVAVLIAKGFKAKRSGGL